MTGCPPEHIFDWCRPELPKQKAKGITSRALEQKAQVNSPTKNSSEVAPSPACMPSSGGDMNKRGQTKRRPKPPSRQAWNQPGSSRKQPGITMTSINITKWGPQAEKYFRDSTADVIFISEHRQAKKTEAGSMMRSLATTARRAAVSRAQSTSEAGASGGVLVGWWAGLQAVAVGLDIPKQYSHRVAAAMMTLRGGVNILLLAVYGHTGEGA